MNSDKIYRLQGIIGAIALISGAVGYGAKGVLADSKLTSKYIDFQYFVSNTNSASVWPYIYWLSGGVFALGWLSVVLLEIKKRNS